MFPILIDDVVDHFVRHLREASALDDLIDLVLAGNHLRSGGGREVGAKDQLVFDAVFNGRDEGLIVP